MDYYLLQKYCRMQSALYLPLHGLNHLQLKFYTTMQNFNVFRTLIASKRRIEQLNYFSIGLQMLKI